MRFGPLEKRRDENIMAYKVSEGVFTNDRIIIPMEDVQHIEKRGPDDKIW